MPKRQNGIDETANLFPNLITDFEIQEADSWSDYFRDVPADLADQLQIKTLEAGSGFAVSMAQIDILAYNRVIGLGLEHAVSENQLAELIQFYRNNGSKRFFIQLSPTAKPKNLSKMLKNINLKHYNNWVKLYQPIEDVPSVNTSLRIDQINREHSEIFSNILVQAFEWPATLKQLLSVPVGKPGWKHYMAFKGDIPVACAAGYIRGEFASLAIAATLQEFRGLGAQTALINQRIRDAANAGCHWIISETAEETPEKPVPSFRNMLKLGFRVAYKRPNYIYVDNGDQS
jgi:GNAT superfamily N-acetyltransferase